MMQDKDNIVLLSDFVQQDHDMYLGDGCEEYDGCGCYHDDSGDSGDWGDW